MSVRLVLGVAVLVVGAVLLVLCLLLGTGIAFAEADPVTAEAFGVTLSDVPVGGLFLLGVTIGALGMLGLALVVVGSARKRHKKAALKREQRSARGDQESLAEENARLQAQLEQQQSGGGQ